MCAVNFDAIEAKLFGLSGCIGKRHHHICNLALAWLRQHGFARMR